MTRGGKTAPLVLTIGHSTRPLPGLIELLQANGVTRVVDVRTVPRSRRNPQFNSETLPDALRAVGIDYVHMPELGGLRHPRADSPNAGWRNDSFRGFADYMQTPEFEANLQRLMDMAQDGPIALMCAEALPWRCHRSLIADALILQGNPVEHIMSKAHRSRHELTAWAKVDGNTITYPPETAEIDHDAGGHEHL
jgi:uncharacterized protein (DUF488 family)